MLAAWQTEAEAAGLPHEQMAACACTAMVVRMQKRSRCVRTHFTFSGTSSGAPAARDAEQCTRLWTGIAECAHSRLGAQSMV